MVNGSVELVPYSEDDKYFQCILSGEVYRAGETIGDRNTGNQECLTAAELRAMLPQISGHGAVLLNHNPDNGHIGTIRAAYVDTNDVLHVTIALHAPVTCTATAAIRQQIRDGHLRCMSIGWDKRYATNGKRFIEVSLVEKGHFERAKITQIRASADGADAGSAGALAEATPYEFAVVRDESCMIPPTTVTPPQSSPRQLDAYAAYNNLYNANRAAHKTRTSIHMHNASTGQSTLGKRHMATLMETATPTIMDPAAEIASIRATFDQHRAEKEAQQKRIAELEARVAESDAREAIEKQRICAMRATDVQSAAFQGAINRFILSQYTEGEVRATAQPGSQEAVAFSACATAGTKSFTDGYMSLIGSSEDMGVHHAFVKHIISEAANAAAEAKKNADFAAGLKLESNVAQRLQKSMGVATPAAAEVRAEASSGKRTADTDGEPEAKRCAYPRGTVYYNEMLAHFRETPHPGGNAPIPEGARKFHWKAR